MSALPQRADWTIEQYLTYEREADSRHEYIGGLVYAMAGASERHNQIAAALTHALYGQMLDRPCQVFQSDMRVTVGESAFFYPDVVAICGQPIYTDERRDTLLNPAVIIEVLSPSTEDYDRGRKFTHYRAISTLSDYLLISQNRMLIEHYTRQDETWVLREYRESTDRIDLASVGCGLLLGDVYRKVVFNDAD